jgi:hypothetical protein
MGLSSDIGTLKFPVLHFHNFRFILAVVSFYWFQVSGIRVAGPRRDEGATAPQVDFAVRGLIIRLHIP